MEKEDLRLKEEIMRMIMTSYGNNSATFEKIHPIKLFDKTEVEIIIRYDCQNLIFDLPNNTNACNNCRKIIKDFKITDITVKQIGHSNKLEKDILEAIIEVIRILKNCLKNQHKSKPNYIEDISEEIPSPKLLNIGGNPEDEIREYPITKSNHSLEQEISLEESNVVSAVEEGNNDVLYIGIPNPQENDAEQYNPKLNNSSSSSLRNFSIGFEYITQQRKINVMILSKVCTEMRIHAEETNKTQREVGGILIGEVKEIIEQNEIIGYWVLITDIIPFESINTSISHLTIDEDVWIRTETIFQNLHSVNSKQKIGWYHTHPNQGIFFSPPDVDFHSIFQNIWQMAFVIDPQTFQTGLFYWEDYRKKISEKFLFSLNESPSHPNLLFQKSYINIFFILMPILFASILFIWGGFISLNIYSIGFKFFLLFLGCIWVSSYVSLWYKLEKHHQNSKSTILENNQIVLIRISIIIFLLTIVLFFLSLFNNLACNFFSDTAPCTATYINHISPANNNNKDNNIKEINGIEDSDNVIEGEIDLVDLKLKIIVNNKELIYQKFDRNWRPENNGRDEVLFFKESLKINIGSKNKDTEFLQNSLKISPVDSDWGEKTRNAFVELMLSNANEGKKKFLLKREDDQISFNFK